MDEIGLERVKERLDVGVLIRCAPQVVLCRTPWWVKR